MARVSTLSLIVPIAISGPLLLWHRLEPAAAALPNGFAALIWGSLLAAWGLIRYHKHIPIAVSLANWTWLSVASWLVVQTRLVSIPYADELIFTLAALMLAWALHAMGRNLSSGQRATVGTWFAVGFLIASYGTAVLQTLQLTRVDWLAGYVMPVPAGMQPFGNLGQRNQAAFVHVIGILGVSAVFTSLTPPTFKQRWIALPLCLPMIFGLAMTSSRLFLVLGGLVWLASAWRLNFIRCSGGNHPFVRLVKYVAIIFIFIFAYILIYILFTALIPMLAPNMTFDNVIERLGNVSNLTRIVLQQQALAMFISHPLVGAGWGSFSAFGLNWSDRSALPLFADHSHFLPSHWLAELGIVGALLATPLAALIARIISSPYLWKKQFFMQWLTLISLLYSCSEYPLWMGYFLFPIAFAIGILENELGHPPDRKEKFTPDRFRISASWASLVGFIVAAGSIWFSMTFLNLHFLAKKVFTGKSVTNNLYFEIYETPFSFGFSAIKDLYLFIIIPMNQEDLSDKLALGERVAGRYVDSAILLRLGLLYTLSGDIERSKRLIQDACRFYPSSCDQVLRDLGKFEPAIAKEIWEEMRSDLATWWSSHQIKRALPNVHSPTR